MGGIGTGISSSCGRVASPGVDDRKSCLVHTCDSPGVNRKEPSGCSLSRVGSVGDRPPRGRRTFLPEKEQGCGPCGRRDRSWSQVHLRGRYAPREYTSAAASPERMLRGWRAVAHWLQVHNRLGASSASQRRPCPSDGRCCAPVRIYSSGVALLGRVRDTVCVTRQRKIPYLTGRGNAGVNVLH